MSITSSEPISPRDRWVVDDAGAIIGIRPARSERTEARLARWNDDATALLKPDGSELVALTAAQVQAVQNLVGDHGENVGWGVTSWYAGELASAVTPVITADGDLTSATDQVPLYWRVITNPPPYDPGVTLVDDVEAAQRLLDGAPNVVTVSAGQTVVIELDEDLVAVYAICISTATERPADYTGGANIISGAGSTLADVLAATGMSRLDFSASPAKQVVLLQATQVYGTNYMQLMISGGVRS